MYVDSCYNIVLSSSTQSQGLGVLVVVLELVLVVVLELSRYPSEKSLKVLFPCMGAAPDAHAMKALGGDVMKALGRLSVQPYHTQA